MELLTGKYSFLKTFDDTHLHNPSYLQWVRDYEVIKTLNKTDYLRPISFEELKKYCYTLMQSPHDMFFAIHTIENSLFIGTLRISQMNWRNRVADIGIMIGNKDYWSKGIASDAIQIICYYLFNQCGFRKLTAGFMSINPAMGKIFENLGFKKEGILREQNYFEGKYVDHIYMGCFSNELKSIENI
jgi:RimJ/RimL family protein N-acetyltransferase